MTALLITGPVGVGKTTVAEAVGDALAAASVPPPDSVVDADQPVAEVAQDVVTGWLAAERV